MDCGSKYSSLHSNPLGILMGVYIDYMRGAGNNGGPPDVTRTYLDLAYQRFGRMDSHVYSGEGRTVEGGSVCAGRLSCVCAYVDGQDRLVPRRAAYHSAPDRESQQRGRKRKVGMHVRER